MKNSNGDAPTYTLWKRCVDMLPIVTAGFGQCCCRVSCLESANVRSLHEGITSVLYIPSHLLRTEQLHLLEGPPSFSSSSPLHLPAEPRQTPTSSLSRNAAFSRASWGWDHKYAACAHLLLHQAPRGQGSSTSFQGCTAVTHSHIQGCLHGYWFCIIVNQTAVDI